MSPQILKKRTKTTLPTSYADNLHSNGSIAQDLQSKKDGNEHYSKSIPQRFRILIFIIQRRIFNSLLFKVGCWFACILFLEDIIELSVYTYSRWGRQNPTQPRIVYLNDSLEPLSEGRLLLQRLSTQVWISFGHYRTTLSDMNDGSNPKKRKESEHEEFETETCKATYQWQKDYLPSCNTIHEIDMRDSTFEYMTHGGFRDIWIMQDSDGKERIVKTLVQKKNHNHREFDRHRRDAMAMDQLHASVHIPSIYGSCSSTGVFDYSRNGDIESLVEEASENGNVKGLWTSEEMLRYSWQVMAAIADIHDKAIAHTDISSDQFLWMDGMFKLNDFNRARFIRRNIQRNRPCDFFIAKSPGKHRSPEEYKGKEEGLTEAIDVFSAGHVLYYILVKSDWKEKVDRAQLLIKDGKRPQIPANISNNTGPMESAIMEAIDMCFVHDAQERPSSRDIERFLHDTMDRFHVADY